MWHKHGKEKTRASSDVLWFIDMSDAVDGSEILHQLIW